MNLLVRCIQISLEYGPGVHGNDLDALLTQNWQRYSFIIIIIVIDDVIVISGECVHFVIPPRWSMQIHGGKVRADRMGWLEHVLLDNLVLKWEGRFNIRQGDHLENPIWSEGIGSANAKCGERNLKNWARMKGSEDKYMVHRGFGSFA